MQNLRFGKHAPKHDYRTLCFKNYVSENLASPPVSYDVLSRVYAKLKISDPSILFPMDGNDSYGDCTCAAIAHATTIYNGLVGKKKIWDAKSVIKFYLHQTGGIDSGCNELDVLNYWQSKGAEGEKITAFVKVDPKNHTHVKQAIQLFGGVYLGFQVQQNAQADFISKKVWTPGKLTNDGHAVFATSYDKNSVTVLTWGSTQKGTWAWWDECVDEAYAILPPEAKKKDFDPGFDFKQLLDDLHEIAG
jgi:hypothetical protein